MTDTLEYEGDDLEAMAHTVNYQRWIMDEFRPFIGRRIVEVGAGTGTFSRHFIESDPETLTLVEPSEMFGTLERRVGGVSTTAKVQLHNAFFPAVQPAIKQAGGADTIVYINVLEHVEDDAAELRLMHDTLTPGGHILIFVPALMSLYSKFDEMIGHFRRYTKRELEDKCRSAGFQIVKSTYFDLAGIAPWYLKFKILRSHALNVGAVVAYDKVAIPVVRSIESVLPVPVGKNVLLVAKKPVD